MGKNLKSDVGDNEPTEINDLIISRLTGGNDNKKKEKELETPTVQTAIGELRLIDPNEIIVTGERFRRQIEVSDLVNSIRNYGQIVPILVRNDMSLVNGLRRLSACQELAVPVLAHVVDLVDAESAQIEEDRCREQLTPYEMYLITEALRPRLEDEAWTRKALGKAVDKAAKKGRVDDLLAEHVGISRGTLRKIREIITAWSQDPQRYDAVKQAMETDRRIDRHYKAFKALSEPAYKGRKLQAVAFDPNWQKVAVENAASLCGAAQRLGLRELVEDNALLLVPSAIDSLPLAVELVAKTGAKLVLACGSSEKLLLVGRFGKGTDASNETIAKVKSCDVSFEDALKIAASTQNTTVIDLTHALRQDRKAA